MSHIAPIVNIKIAEKNFDTNNTDVYYEYLIREHAHEVAYFLNLFFINMKYNFIS